MTETLVMTRAEFKRDEQNVEEARRRRLAKALKSFKFFVTVLMRYDGTRGLSERQRRAGMRAQGSDGIDFTDGAYDRVWDFFQAAEVKSALLMLPRGTGKTTLVALWCLWMALRNPNIRIGIIAYKFEQASGILNMVRAWMLEATGDLRKVFGAFGRLPAAGANWGRDDRLDFPGKSAVQRDGTIEAVGMEGASTGAHWDIVILEDLVNKESSQTDSAVEDVCRFVGLASALGVTRTDEYGNILGKSPKIMIGTPWAEKDAYMNVLRAVDKQKKEGEVPAWEVLRLKARIPRAVARLVQNQDGTSTNATFYEYDQSCQPRFKHLTDAVLKGMRLPAQLGGMGAVDYASQMDLDPIPMENRTFKAEWFVDHYYEDADIWDVGPDGKTKTLKSTVTALGFSDLSGTSGASKDRTAHQAWVLDARQHLYLVDEVVGRFTPDDEQDEAMTPNSNLGFMAKWTKKYGFSWVGVEGGVLRTVYEPLAKKWNRTHPDLQVRLHKVASGGARGNLTNDRAMALAQMAEAGMIHIRREQTEWLEEVLRYTPSRDNSRDDRVAAAALAALNTSHFPVTQDPDDVKKPTQVQTMWEQTRKSQEDEGEVAWRGGQYDAYDAA